jgi:hypothetical protein
MEEQAISERRGLWAGGGTAIVAVAACVLAINNPTEADLRTHVGLLASEELASSGNVFMQMMSVDGGQAASQLITVRSDNFLIFSRFDVGIPDTTIFGGSPASQACLIGVMNRFVSCGEAGTLVAEVPNASSASPERDSLAAQDTALVSGGEAQPTDDPVLLRTHGWLCDGVRVKFAPGTPWESVLVNVAGKSSSWRMTVGSQGVITVLESADSRYAGAVFEFSNSDLFFNDQPCQPANR